LSTEVSFLALHGKVKGISLDPARPFPCHDPDLVREFLGIGLDVEPEFDVVKVADNLKLDLLVFLEPGADPHIEVLGILPYYDKVDVL